MLADIAKAPQTKMLHDVLGTAADRELIAHRVMPQGFGMKMLESQFDSEFMQHKFKAMPGHPGQDQGQFLTLECHKHPGITITGLGALMPEPGLKGFLGDRQSLAGCFLRPKLPCFQARNRKGMD